MLPETALNFRNQVLRSLRQDLLEEFAQYLDRVEMPLGEILHRPLEKIEYVYFPETCVISIVTVLENGSGVESGIIGREGVSGTSVIMGEDYSPRESTIQLGGEGWRIRTEDFRDFFEREGVFRRLVLHYIYAFIAQISQNAACLSYHVIEQRLARWLIMFDDRTDEKKLRLTQEFIAQMLGVHRPSVSVSAKRLQDLGFISYNRGTIEILDRDGLEGLACECYRMINTALAISKDPAV